MKNTSLCQSCGLPLTNEEVKGTEQSGLKSDDYCNYCYEDSSFKKPEMALEDMKETVKNHMEKKNHPPYMIQKAMRILPALKRWKNHKFVL